MGIDEQHSNHSGPSVKDGRGVIGCADVGGRQMEEGTLVWENPGYDRYLGAGKG